MLKVLIVEDEPPFSDLLVQGFMAHDIEPIVVSTLAAATEACRNLDDFAAITWDGNIEGGSTLALIAEVAPRYNGVMVARGGDVNTRILQMDAGCVIGSIDPRAIATLAVTLIEDRANQT